jgi:hypothetical protein
MPSCARDVEGQVGDGRVLTVRESCQDFSWLGSARILEDLLKVTEDNT